MFIPQVGALECVSYILFNCFVLAGPCFSFVLRLFTSAVHCADLGHSHCLILTYYAVKSVVAPLLSLSFSLSREFSEFENTSPIS